MQGYDGLDTTIATTPGDRYQVSFWLNDDSGGNWIGLELEGAGKSNRDAIGAEVTLTAGGKQQRVQIMGGTSYCSASDKRVHFGLGAARTVDRVAIQWPSGQIETFDNLPVNQARRITEKAAAR